MRNVRRKALAAVWIQWASIALLALAAIPPTALIFRAHESSLALVHNHLTWEMIGVFVTVFVTGVLQALVLRDGCFGVCAFPPLMPLRPGGVFLCRLGTQGLFWLAMAAVMLTILGSLPLHLGLILSFGLLSLHVAVFDGLCLAVGYEQVVPTRFRFFFALHQMWMVSRIWGRLHRGERTCIAALKDEALTPEKRLLAMELIALRSWVPGGLLALREIAHAEGMKAPLAVRAREILASIPGQRRAA